MITRRTIMISWTASGTAGFILVFLSLLDPLNLGLPVYVASYFTFLWEDKTILIALTILLLPPSILYHLQWQWKKAVDRNLPNFLRDVANAQYTGMTFIRALEFSAQKDYGPLSTHLRWALSKISWGIPYEEALQAMADRIDTPLEETSKRPWRQLLSTSKSLRTWIGNA
jgi:pilus assembly protein TadC